MRRTMRLSLQDGLKALVSPIRHQKPSRLKLEQQQQLKEMIQTQRPNRLWYRTADVDRSNSLRGYCPTLRGKVERFPYL